jgi:glycosyltransferase involved in cell wall biosynthesis
MEATRVLAKADFIFTTFFFTDWFDVYSNNNALKKMVVCNHDCINENLSTTSIEISRHNQCKMEYLFASKAVYVPSLWTYTNTLRFYPTIKDKLFLIPHFIEFEGSEVVGSINDRFQKFSRLSPDHTLRLLHVGSIDSYKNFYSIYKMLIESENCVELILLGAKLSADNMEKIRTLRSLGHNVILFPFASEDEKFLQYSKCDVLLMPSHDEGFSFPTYEAALTGLPIVKLSKNPWGFESLNITNSFSTKKIVSALNRHYSNNKAHELSFRVLKELEENNELSTKGLRELFQFLEISSK